MAEPRASELDEFDLLVLGHLLYATSPSSPEDATSSSRITAYLPFDYMTFRERLERLEGEPFYFVKAAFVEQFDEVPETHYWLTFRGFTYVRRNIQPIAAVLERNGAPDNVFDALRAFRDFRVTRTQPFVGQQNPTSKGKKIPASDRYISAQHNQLVVTELRDRVAELRHAVEQDRTNDFADREGRLGELATLEIALAQPQISVPLVENILKRTVVYLANKFVDNAIGIIAGSILTLAAQHFGIQAAQ